MEPQSVTGVEISVVDLARISELVDNYHELKDSGAIRRFNEESTKKDFILPLFEALGWNVYNKGKSDNQVTAEEGMLSKKRVDYGFRINGIPKFFLEAKSLKEDRIEDNEGYVTQAIDYAWMKSCSWAILTNFETISVFNADWKYSHYANNLVFTLHAQEFTTSDRLLLLSKEAFKQGLLDKRASEYGKKQKKNPIDKQLVQDLISFRELLSRDIIKNNMNDDLTQSQIDEAVQRILDRLIFIRNAEDRELEENRLEAVARQWSDKGKGKLMSHILKIYGYYDENYNSTLFHHNKCDELIIDNKVLYTVIVGLNRSTDNSYRYDFSVIDSDVLGDIYELYLGNVLRKTKKGTQLSDSETHRREQGIYYTPEYIVEFMIKNTVLKYIKGGIREDYSTIRILDPACGSGSFLMGAYQAIANSWIAKNGDPGILRQTKFDIDNEGDYYSYKVEILKRNIFGVDLDPKAVEIAQLNLLLKISEKKRRLPILTENIRNGNSLFPSSIFSWDSAFGGSTGDNAFDVIIGNPPYVSWNSINREERVELEKGTYLGLRYDCRPNHKDAQPNYYLFFLVMGSSLVSRKGIVSFILPQEWLYHKYARQFRNFLIENFGEIELYIFNPDFSVFSGPDKVVGTNSLIIILKKEGKGILRVFNIDSKIESEVRNILKQNKLRSALALETSRLIDNPWMLKGFKHIELKNRIRRLSNLIEFSNRDYFEVKGGFQPPISSIETFQMTAEEWNRLPESEKDVVFPCIYNAREIKQFVCEVISSRYWIVANTIASEMEFKQNYPNIYSILDKRIRNKRKLWWHFPNVRNLDLIRNYPTKILSPRTSAKPSFAIDDISSVIKGTNTMIFCKNIDTYYVAGILNSTLSTFWYDNFGYEYHGSKTKKYEPDKARKYLIPIRLVSDERKDKVVALVRHLIDLKSKINKAKNTTSQVESMRQNIVDDLKQLDEIVYAIYELRNSDIYQMATYVYR